MGKKSKFLRKEVWRMMKAAKGITVLVLLIQIVTALAAVIYTDSLNRLFTAITEKQWSRSLLILFLAVGGLLMIQDILNGVANYVTDVQTMKAQKGYMTSFLEKVNGLSAKQCLEPHTLDMINSAREGRETGVEFMVHVELLFSYYLFYYGFMMAYLYTIHPLLAAVILIAYVPSVLTYRLKNKISVQRNQKAAIYRRQRKPFMPMPANGNF